MKVIAKQVGEHPQGTWRQPGEKFEFYGKKMASWMMTEAEAVKTKAENRSDAEDAAEINRAVFEATAKVKAKIKARKEAKNLGAKIGEALAKEKAKSPEELPEKEKHEDTPKQEKAEEPDEFYAVHRGAGKWDVFGQNKKIVENGGDLNKADASALVELLLAE